MAKIKAAVKKNIIATWGPKVVTDGMSKEDASAEIIAAGEVDEDQLEEIWPEIEGWTAPAPEPKKEEKKEGPFVTVLKEFRDINDFNQVHTVGSKIYGLTEDRMDRLKKLKYVE